MPKLTIKNLYRYKCEIIRVVDGDTVDVDIDLGFGMFLHGERIRLSGVNAPETRTRDLKEKARGIAAKQFAFDFCSEGSMILETTEFRGKFGRILGRIYSISRPSKCLNDELLKHGHAKKYNGGKR